MHDLGSSQYEGEAGQELGQEYEGEFAQELGELNGEFEGEFEGEFGEIAGENEEGEYEFGEMQEMEMAAELLEIQSEAELDQFLEKLKKRASRGLKKFARSATGRAIGAMLKGIAKKALPIATKMAGTYFGGPAGGMIGSKLGGMAANLFEMELEGLSQEDREFEVARRFVLLSKAAVKHAIGQPANVNPRIAARTAITKAAQRYAPGLVRNTSQPSAPTQSNVAITAAIPANVSQSGRWFRKGNSIVLAGF